jgi:hypothetical protein
MEQGLDVYPRPYAPRYPVICMDESSKQVLSEVRAPVPLGPGQSRKEDYHYRRQGVWNLFVAFAPACGRRDVTVTARRTTEDWAYYVRKIVDELYPKAQRITLVCDQLNTHTLASLYDTFPAAEAHRLARKLELVHTPKHGSWLNMAEIEFSALSRQCLERRFPDHARFVQEIAAWTTARNRAHTTVRWRFTTADARIKLASLYPNFDD